MGNGFGLVVDLTLKETTGDENINFITKTAFHTHTHLGMMVIEPLCQDGQP